MTVTALKRAASSDWVEERLHEDLRIALKADRTLFDTKTEHQRLRIFDNASFGRVMTLDNVVQITEGDEFIYSEMLAHVPILAHGAARRVLIIGGGDGAVLREVLKHPGVEHVTMVEIDRGVVDLCRTYFPGISGDAFDDPRFELVIADGLDFVKAPTGQFDVMIVDSTDPIGPGEALFTEAFYEGCKRCIGDTGVVVTQNGVPFLQAGELRNSTRLLQNHFADVSCYLATVPTYVGGVMALGWASDAVDLRSVSEQTLADGFARMNGKTRYYTPAVHRGAFALPPYIADLVER